MAASEDVRESIWRAVETQYRAATMLLVDTLAEQHLLESLLEESKPPPPRGAQGLHWLLFTPFRYPPPAPRGSRFRGLTDPGVFYGAVEIRTACAEAGFWRWRFLLDSEGLMSIDPRPQTLFRCEVAGSAYDLRTASFRRQRKRWMDPNDYAHCQRLARKAREDGIHLILYESVRDPAPGVCTAVLTPRAFRKREPTQVNTWLLSVTREVVSWKLDDVFVDQTFEFHTDRWMRQLQ